MTDQDRDHGAYIDPKFAAEYLRNETLDIIRREMSAAWKALNERQQEDVAARIEHMAKNAVVRCVRAIAMTGKMSIIATMGKLGMDKDRNAVVPFTFGSVEDDEKLAIWKHVNRQVVVVLMDPEEYNNFETKVEIMKDEPGLPLEDGQEAGQPHWPTVAAAVSDGEAPAPAPAAPAPKGDAHDAHIAEDDDEVDAGKPPSDLLDDDLDEDGGDTDIAKAVNLENPTKPKKK